MGNKVNKLKLDLQHFGGAIQNLDREDNQQNELKQNIANALESGDSDKMAKALTSMAEGIQTQILQDAQTLVNDQINDERVLAERGIHSLTKEETEYYNEVIDGTGFAGVEKLVPATVIDRVFDELVAEHPILAKINFVNTTGVTKWILKKGNVNSAWWGKLVDAIKEQLDEGFETVDTNLYKLSAFLPVANAMLELGPRWLDRYVRTVLVEASAIALEEAVIAGTGEDQPIGMIKDLDGAVVNGKYPDKEATVLPDFSVKSLYAIRGDLTNAGKRKVRNIILVVNPNDYNYKLAEQIVHRNASGQFMTNLPIDATIIESVAMPQGKLVAGLAKDYFMGVGSERKVKASTEYRFLEDETVYITRMLANGRPKDNNSFKVYDINALGTADPAAPANLASSNVTDTSMTLAWDPVAYDTGIASYEVFRDGVSIGTTGATTFNDSGLTASTTYSYQVKAIGTNGLESDLSSALSVTTAAAV
ncbi:phage major capsid protein, HK97 family [Thalassobacillus cyri]|uniref:Phage major capsid protein, HK97 family n=1 Tax=Thalassobacillus cyri TaxID=571932 RepID=A0A1H4H424_9BACI|nr:phage major capsid protein, HK97 family [Thalassobacillus cyri]